MLTNKTIVRMVAIVFVTVILGLLAFQIILNFENIDWEAIIEELARLAQ